MVHLKFPPMSAALDIRIFDTNLCFVVERSSGNGREHIEDMLVSKDLCVCVSVTQ